MASFSGSSISLNWAAPAQNFPGNQYEYLIYRGSTANFNLTDGTKIDEVIHYLMMILSLPPAPTIMR